MALADEVKARYSTARLKQLTTQGDQSAAAIDDTVLGYAVTDVQADFEIIAGVAYDNSESRHVVVAVEGVVAKLNLRAEGAGQNAEGRHEKYLDRLERLAKVTGRNRIIPETKSVYTPTSEQQEIETVTPWDDWPAFEGMLPNTPD